MSNILEFIQGRLISELKRVGPSVVAADTGISRATIYNWMEKGNAPIDKLVLLEKAGIDVTYILTGLKASTHMALAAVKTATETGMAVEAITGNRADGLAVQEAIAAQSLLKPDEAALLDNYRNSEAEGKKAISATSAAFAQQAATQKVSGGE